GADRFGKAAVVERRGDRAVIGDEAVAEPVEFVRRHARLDMGGDEIERFGGQPAGPAHAFKVVLSVDPDLAGARRAARLAEAWHQILLHDRVLFSVLRRSPGAAASGDSPLR